ncbi:MAG: metallophosphoesterase [Bacteroidota bacterium]
MGPVLNAGMGRKKSSESLLRIAHITDVHMRPEGNALQRFNICIEEIKKHGVDFFLNTGDSIFAADYDDITRDNMLMQWELWDHSRANFAEYEMFSCLGNHDMWWAAPNTSDSMYGKDYVVQRLGIPKRYYSFDRSGWHFIVLDSNNSKGGHLDPEQRKWLEDDLEGLPLATPVIVMSHYPIMGVGTIIGGGNHTDSKYITKLFYAHKDKKIHCLSGHVHLLDRATYNNVNYYCNGSVSGYWWSEGDEDSAEPFWCHQTPPGYAILDLKEDGSLRSTYHRY